MKLVRNRLSASALLMLSVAAASQVRAVQFNRSDDCSAGINTALSYDASYRAEGQDKAGIARTSSEIDNNSMPINSGEGHLNFKKICVNTDLTYYELHRTRYALFKLKAGNRHQHKQGDMYFNADSYPSLVVDHYDNRDKLWRFTEPYTINRYVQQPA